MAMGKRKRRQEGMWVTAMDLPKSPGHPFYQRLNRVLDEAGFDRFAEKRCEESTLVRWVDRACLLGGTFA